MSQRLRIILLCSFLAALALGAGYVVLGRGQSSSSAAVKTIKPLHPVNHRVRRPAEPVARSKPIARKTATARPKAKRKAPAAVLDGMPAALALELSTHAVVVVSLYAPKSGVDALATAEARAGAKLAGAGFVALNVANEKQAAPLTALLTGASTAADRLPDDPAVLIFQRPKALFVRFNGFTDRETVAQAAQNAGQAGL